MMRLGKLFQKCEKNLKMNSSINWSQETLKIRKKFLEKSVFTLILGNEILGMHACNLYRILLKKNDIFIFLSILIEIKYEI